MSKCIKIDNCEGCPHHRTSRVYTGDSFETVWRVECVPLHRIIDNCEEPGGDPTKIPDDCPLPNFPNP